MDDKIIKQRWLGISKNDFATKLFCHDHIFFDANHVDSCLEKNIFFQDAHNTHIPYSSAMPKTGNIKRFFGFSGRSDCQIFDGKFFQKNFNLRVDT